MVPRLRALDEDVGVGPEPAGIVEGADAHADDVGPRRHLDVERRAALAAKDTCDGVPRISLRDVALRRAARDAERRRRHAHRRDVRRAALALAVAAVALQRELRLALALVARRTAQASTGSCSHVWFSSRRS